MFTKQFLILPYVLKLLCMLCSTQFLLVVELVSFQLHFVSMFLLSHHSEASRIKRERCHAIILPKFSKRHSLTHVSVGQAYNRAMQVYKGSILYDKAVFETHLLGTLRNFQHFYSDCIIPMQ